MLVRCPFDQIETILAAIHSSQSSDQTPCYHSARRMPQNWRSAPSIDSFGWTTCTGQTVWGLTQPVPFWRALSASGSWGCCCFLWTFSCTDWLSLWRLWGFGPCVDLLCSWCSASSYLSRRSTMGPEPHVLSLSSEVQEEAWVSCPDLMHLMNWQHRRHWFARLLHHAKLLSSEKHEPKKSQPACSLSCHRFFCK